MAALQNILFIHRPLRKFHRTLALLLTHMPDVEHEIPYTLVVVELEGPRGGGAICKLIFS